MLTIALLLLLSRFSRVRLCATPQTAAHQAAPSLGFSRQEHWSGLPFPSPMHEGEKWKWSRSVVSDSSRPRGLQPTRLLHPWNSSAQIAPGFRVCLLTFFLTTGFFYDGLPWWLRGRESTCRCRRCRLDSWVGKILWRRKWQPTLVFLPEKSHGQRSLVGYGQQGHKRVRYDLVTEQQQDLYTWFCPVLFVLGLFHMFIYIPFKSSRDSENRNSSPAFKNLSPILLTLNNDYSDLNLSIYNDLNLNICYLRPS